jgi:hypothetical protein
MIPASVEHDFDQAFHRLRALIRQARPHLPGDLCGELVLAMLDYSDAQLEIFKRDLTKLEFGGRGPEPSSEKDSHGVGT